jgi:hypothetical protein
MKWEWDFKDAMPYTMKMKTINFMAYMFHNSPYGTTLNGPIENLIRRMLMNTHKLPDRLDKGAYTKTTPIKGRMKRHFETIESYANDLSNPTGVKLRDFYVTKYSALDTRRKNILEGFRDFHELDTGSGKNEFAHFCMPFLAIQAASQADNNYDVVTNANMNSFISRVGHLTLIDLYTYPANKLTGHEATGIEDGYSWNILQFTETSFVAGEIRAKVTITTPPTGNGMKCDLVNGGCTDGTPQNWCVEDSEGNCTAGH